MGEYLVASKEISTLIQTAIQVPQAGNSFRILDRLLAGAAQQNISISCLLLQIDRLFDLRLKNTPLQNLVEELLRILIDQTPTGVYVDCIGPNEFLLILPAINHKQTFELGETIARRFSRIVSGGLGESRIKVTLSGSMAMFPQDGESRMDLIRNLRESLYTVGKSGGDQIIHVKIESLMPKTIYFTPLQLERLQQRSKREGVREASLVREALDAFFYS